MTRSRLDSFPNHYCLCLELYRDIRLQCMIRKSFVHRLSLILILDRISIEMCSVFDRFCTMKFSRFLLSHSKQLIHYSASVGSCQALFQTFSKSFQCLRAHPMPRKAWSLHAAPPRSGCFSVTIRSNYTRIAGTCQQLFKTFFKKVNCKSNFTELNAKCRSIYLGISLDLHILGILMNDVILLLPS